MQMENETYKTPVLPHVRQDPNNYTKGLSKSPTAALDIVQPKLLHSHLCTHRIAGMVWTADLSVEYYSNNPSAMISDKLNGWSWINSTNDVEMGVRTQEVAGTVTNTVGRKNPGDNKSTLTTLLCFGYFSLIVRIYTPNKLLIQDQATDVGATLLTTQSHHLHILQSPSFNIFIAIKLPLQLIHILPIPTHQP